MKDNPKDANYLAGVGLRIPHHGFFLEHRPAVGWLEVHSENYFCDARLRDDLLALREHYPISLHGVGLSLGSADPLDRRHLQRLKTLVDEVDPLLVSEHLSWSSINGIYLNDLLPLLYTRETLRHFAERVDATQQALGRQMLIENPSSYLSCKESTLDEWTFYAALPELTGCGLLLDLNNIFVTSQNQGFDPDRYLDAVPFERVQEIHLAGHSRQPLSDGTTMLVDTHGSQVSDPVWALYRQVLACHGAVRTLIEWDTDLPEPQLLLDEANKAATLMAETPPPGRMYA